MRWRAVGAALGGLWLVVASAVHTVKPASSFQCYNIGSVASPIKPTSEDLYLQAELCSVPLGRAEYVREFYPAIYKEPGTASLLRVKRLCQKSPYLTEGEEASPDGLFVRRRSMICEINKLEVVRDFSSCNHKQVVRAHSDSYCWSFFGIVPSGGKSPQERSCRVGCAMDSHNSGANISAVLCYKRSASVVQTAESGISGASGGSICPDQEGPLPNADDPTECNGSREDNHPSVASVDSVNKSFLGYGWLAVGYIAACVAIWGLARDRWLIASSCIVAAILIAVHAVSLVLG